MEKTSARLLLSGILFILTGCYYFVDRPTNGITRTVYLPAVPDVDCIKRVLEGIPEIKITSESHWISDTETPDGITKQAHFFKYEWEDLWVHLNVHKHYDGKIHLSNNRLYSRWKRPSSGEIREVRRMIKVIEKGLATQCEIKEIMADMQEKCYRIKCPE